MLSPTGIIPETLMYPERKQAVIDFLLKAPYPGDFKRRILEGWCITVGCRVRSDDYRRVYDSGVDAHQDQLLDTGRTEW